MRFVKMSFVCFLVLIMGGAVMNPAAAQEQNYSNSKYNYTLQLPSGVWRLISEPDEIHQHTEFIYGDRNDGFLRIRKETLPDGATIKEFAHQDLDQKERFLPGYIGGGKEEAFSGRLNGVNISFEYTQAGKPMAGRTYYLQADSHTIFALRFT